MPSPAGRSRIGYSQVAITGAACRLPGADNEDAFWKLLDEGRCAVGPLPSGRWNRERFFHSRKTEPGFSYCFDGGYLADPLAFDPAVFGISPREAAEIDPQQRLLLEVVWEALEDSGIPPSALAGSEVGVYVGGSSLDYGNLHTTDTAAIESHFMTGNTLSILSNRISYAFDLRGPSFTIDTACSSSLVAFAEAHAAIESGRVDMAIVAGVNILMSPTPFIGFSRASMLSPTGLCRPFSALADGYVRAEGAVAMVLARLETAVQRHYPVRAVALASGINSDGRTSGISLPSPDGQRQLLDRIYGRGEIDPARLSFVEAHGTGTKVGDPAEATAIGEALGQMRSAPLPIGSVKSNIGHLEPASGLAGMFKAILAMEHRRLPQSLHLEEINPLIDFGRLNLKAAVKPVPLAATGTLYAGISSFGFGGTNAHVVLRQAEGLEIPIPRTNGAAGPAPEIFLLSAHSRPALNAAASSYGDMFASGQGEPERVAKALGWQRDAGAHRLALPLDSAESMAGALAGFAETGAISGGVAGVASSVSPKICFVFSGNGSQWPGMGRTAYAGNTAFRRQFMAIDEIFHPLSGWSLFEALHDPALAERLPLTRIAQPLLFAIQSALVAAMAEWGLKPDMVLGHSVGEVAAAEACGAIGLADAVHVIFHRSEHQEVVQGLGTMAVASLGWRAAQELIDESGLPGLEVAAINSPSSVTISGPEEKIKAFGQIARKRRVAMRVLNLAYPFHSAILEPLRLPLLDSLGVFSAQPAAIPFISTVTGDRFGGDGLHAEYWWRNVREPVRFREAVEVAARNGAGLFIEIGPRPILTANIADTVREAGFDSPVMPSLVEKDDASMGDPLRSIAARALVLGCRLDRERLFGKRPVGRTKLPAYPWQRKQFTYRQTSEGLDFYGHAPRHPLIGAKLQSGGTEWRNLLDSTVLPYLADHRIDDEIVVPGSAFAEMALAVAREIFPGGPVGLEDFDLLQWLPLRPDAMREISVRFHDDTRLVEIWSRPRLGADEWTLHARGRISALASPSPAAIARQSLPHRMTSAQVYDSAARTGVDYGPAFQRVISAERTETLIEVELSPIAESKQPDGRNYVLHPIALDSAFHAMFENIKLRANERYAYLPVRFAALRVDMDGAIPARARVVVDRETDNSLSISLALYTAKDEVIASLTGGLFREVVLERRKQNGVFYHQKQIRLSRFDRTEDMQGLAAAAVRSMPPVERPDSWLILEAFARALAFRSVKAFTGGVPVQAGALVASPLIISFLERLSAAGLATEQAGTWVLADESGLPEPGEILQTFAAEFAGATAEIVLAAQALSQMETALHTGQPVAIRAAIVEQFETCSILFEPVLAAARAVFETVAAKVAPDPVRILVAEPSCLGLLHLLTPLARAGRASVTVIGTNAKRLHHTAARRGAVDGITFLSVDSESEIDPPQAFDLAFGFAFGPVFDGEGDLGRAIARRLSPQGFLCLLQPPDNAIFDILLGASDGWFAASIDTQFPIGRVAAAQDAKRIVLSSDFLQFETVTLGEGAGQVSLAAPGKRAALAAPAVAPVILIDNESALIGDLAVELKGDGRPVHMPAFGLSTDYRAAWPENMSGATADLIFPAFADSGAGADLDRTIAQLAAILRTVQTGGYRLWVLVRGLNAATAEGLDPAAEAIWSFARVAMNEYPAVEFKMVDIALDLEIASAARHLADLIRFPDAEAELAINRTGICAIRAVTGLAANRAAESVPSVRLELPGKGVLAHFDWVETERREPAAHEVEIEIDASGLNFRDIMLATGLLNDDVLDDGLAGAVFGFECAGRVIRVGADVENLKPGDAVMGFGRQSFASHMTADARIFTPLPDGLAVEAAATVPVAFLTAWYSLVHLAQLQPGEWVLIHGAAGGVGLAAIQIARLRGARIAATVSSPDKRALVELMGAERVYNSRSVAFMDAIHADISGVDVVLNSLAGDAMLASLKCLKPFGRFVELGKRDYVANTSMGLRPFRRNLTYFGVDLDQLLSANLPLAQKLMGDMVAHFETGDFAPLPYRAFDWYEAGEAFQLMQAAGHVGKLIVRSAVQPIATATEQKSFTAGPGVHLVVGGTGGFGFETAAWLAAKGARTVVVASRQGRLDPALEARAAAIRAGGVQFIVETVDLTDFDSVAALIGKITAAHGPLAGVIHTAMVLDDGLIAGLDPARTRKVLAPKVEGANNLDRATRGAALDYFVVYSSATTMIGNPGQAAYVAANGYLQGLMRRRAADGLPGLAVGWGAISDAGVLSRDAGTAEKLERISGIGAMRAAEALSYLDVVMATPQAVSTVYCLTIRPGGALRDLSLLQTPSFAHLFAKADGADLEAGIDLAGLIAGKSDAEARALVARLVASEVASILRLSAEEIDPARPLDELGMDSLMSLELRMGIEKRFGVELPVVAISASMNVNDLAVRLMADLVPAYGGGEEVKPAIISETERLIMQHTASDAGLSELLAVTDAIEEGRTAVTALL
jgi:acyl transferase domain-containing protein/NADPH:quinone reductase-like Zn-dependent oxidoreductase/acyl carrier protein